MLSNSKEHSRRAVLAGIGGTMLLGDAVRATDTATDPGIEPRQGGVFTVGIGANISTLNPLTQSDVYIGSVLGQVYDQGVVLHPETNEPTPWLFKDWTYRNDGSSSRISVTLRDDVTWHDGEPFTADDVVFTVQLAKQVNASGQVQSSSYSSVEAVKKQGRYEVEYHLNQPDAWWYSRLLTEPILPEQVWSTVEDPKRYEPAKEGGPIGTGPYEVASVSGDDQYSEARLVPRSDSSYPMPGGVSFVRDGAPFLDEFHIKAIFGAEKRNQALVDGEIDALLSSLEYETAQRFKTGKCQVNIVETWEDGWTQVGYNLRRKPFDDVAFRQFLNRLWDEEYVVESLYGGEGALDGDLLAPPAANELRPYEPTASEVEQFKLFRDENGEFDVISAREYITSHPEAKYDYRYDGDALLVDGVPVEEVHTDNDGNPNQGALSLLTYPAKATPKLEEATTRWSENVRSVGIPVNRVHKGFNDLLDDTFGRNEFDMFTIGWTNLNPQGDYLNVVIGSGFGNPTSYSDANDLIDEIRRTMDRTERLAMQHEVLMKIYQDQPLMVANYARRYQPLLEKWAGWVTDIGGIYNQFTWLNIHRSPEVTLKVKPGSEDPPRMNSRKRGVVPVAVLGGEKFDPASQMNPNTIRFGPPGTVDGCGGASVEHASVEDVNNDGHDDLVLHFRMNETGFEKGDQTAKIAGRTHSGTPITATDHVEVFR